MDAALAARVDCALTNHRWATMAQPLYFDESSKLLSSAAATLAAGEKAQASCLEIAQRCGWLTEV